MTLRTALLCALLGVAAARLRVDGDRQALVDKINGENVGWFAAIHPRFAGQAIGASKSLLGVDIPASKKRLAEKIADGRILVRPSTTLLGDSVIPDNFDSAKNWPQCSKVISDIRDQSNCGCCWAFGAASAASDRLCIATNASVALPLSAQDMCFCGSDSGCDGGFPEAAWEYISNEGLVTGGQNKGIGPFGKDSGLCSAFSLPHCHHHGPVGKDPYPAEGAPGCPSESSPKGPKKCDSKAVAPHNDFDSDKYTFSGLTQSASGPTKIKQMIMEGGPVETAFTVYSDFENYAGGIYKHTSGTMAGGHAVKIVGWGTSDGTDYWKVANSWNPYWGEEGFFRIALGEGGIDDQVTGSPSTATWSKKA